MLTVTNLSKSYGRQTLFEGASFQVAPGERVGVVGRNGSGKTTLFRILLGEEAADSGAVTVPAGYRIGYLAQHLRFDHPTVLAEAASALPPREDGTDETYRAKAVLAGLGFSEDDFPIAPGRPVRRLPGSPQPRPHPPFRPRSPPARRADQLPGRRLHPVAAPLPVRLEGGAPDDHP